jgi:hypothetical protein
MIQRVVASRPTARGPRAPRAVIRPRLASQAILASPKAAHTATTDLRAATFRGAMATRALKLGAAASLALVLATQLRGTAAQARDGAYALYEGGAADGDAAPAPASPPAAVPQFGASLFLGGPWDWGARCLEMVDRVAAQGIATEIQLLPTFYWVDAGPRAPPPGFDPACACAGLSDYYCYSRYNATAVAHWCASLRDDGSCPEITPAEIAEFQTQIGACMARAAAANLSVALNVRVDDGKGLGGWRNTLDFDPTRRYGKFSYEEAILAPLADAAAAAARPGARLAFVPQGEMGASVFFFPEEWVGVNARLRARLARGGARAEVGLAINSERARAIARAVLNDPPLTRLPRPLHSPPQTPRRAAALASGLSTATNTCASSRPTLTPTSTRRACPRSDLPSRPPTSSRSAPTCPRAAPALTPASSRA